MMRIKICNSVIEVVEVHIDDDEIVMCCDTEGCERCFIPDVIIMDASPLEILMSLGYFNFDKISTWREVTYEK